MRTKAIKIVVMIAVGIYLLIAIGAYSPPYDENNAKNLIKARVGKCIKVVKISSNQFNGITHYVAIDSVYTIYIFRVSPLGSISQTGKK
jgi:hypothetical protein